MLERIAVLALCTLAAATGRVAGQPPVRRAPPSIVQVLAIGARGDTLVRQAGIVLDSDGLVATASVAWPPDVRILVVEPGGAAVSATEVARDSTVDVLLLRAPSITAPSARLAERDLQRRDRFRWPHHAAGAPFAWQEGEVESIDTFEGGALATLSLPADSVLPGAPLFTLAGDLAGLAFVAEAEGRLTAYGVPASALRRLPGLFPRGAAGVQADVGETGPSAPVVAAAGRSRNAIAGAPPTSAASAPATRVASATAPVAGGTRAPRGAASTAAPRGALGPARLVTTGLTNAVLFERLLAGDMASTGMARTDLGFAALFNTYIEACAVRCAASLPPNRVELTRTECVRELVTTNWRGVEVDRTCVESVQVGRGVFADPRLLEVQRAHQRELLPGAASTMLAQVTSTEARGTMLQATAEGRSFQADWLVLLAANGCTSPAVEQLEANLVRYARGEEPLRLAGAPSPAPTTGPFRESDYVRLADALIALDAASWVMNRYQPASIHDVEVGPRDPEGHPTSISGRYGVLVLGSPSAGQFIIRFRDGAPGCITYADAPDLCRPVGRGAILEYRAGRYWLPDR
jgi:hypothetical protein